MDETHVDPVCGMEVDTANAADTFEYDGQTYYFCSPGCRASFESDPERYIRAMRDNRP